jgi:hypothetical protein
MDYHYDVFISYAGEPLWTHWARKHLQPLLASYMQQELGRQADIFMDERIRAGAPFPRELAEGLALSRVIVPLFSRDYFGSEWCLHELDLMHERQISASPANLIVPVKVHDGELIPVELGKLQRVDFEPYRNPYLCPGTPDYQAFAKAMQAFAPNLAAAIATAPPLDPAWMAAYETRLNAVYNAEQCGSTVPLQTLTRKPLPYPRSVPRPRP